MTTRKQRDVEFLPAAVLLAAFAGLAGCTPSQYAGQADRDALRTVQQGNQLAMGRPEAFGVAYNPYRPKANEAKEPNEPNATIVVGGKSIAMDGNSLRKLSLDECLRIASRNSRSFQLQKESLYGAALALSNSRRGWDFPLPAGEITGDASRIVVNKGGQTNSGDAAVNGSLVQKFVNGGVMTLGLGVDLASDLMGWKSTSLGSLVSANFTQPLLRGAWRGLAYENQYRMERDFLFTVLEYERFTQSFAVGIVRQYYAVVQQRDQLENERENIVRLEETFQLTKTLVEGGIRSQVELDQADQNLMDARVRLMQDEQQYQNSLDAFKIALGLPVRARVELDYPDAMKELNRVGPLAVPVGEAEAFEVALRSRPDVLRQAAAVRDADRDVEIAADAFLPTLNVTLGISAANAGPRDAAQIRFDRHTRWASGTFQYDLDQTDNRDAYRNTMLVRDRALRQWDEFVDSLRLDIRQSYRSLMLSKQTYELRLRNVDIAKRRRKLAVLEQKEGQASARDVLDAEDALRTAQNNVTGALVNYTTTRLQLMTTLGLLVVDEKGMLHEREKPFEYDRIRQRYPYLSGPAGLAGAAGAGR
jgi:outer membrane protein TolC